MLDEYTNIITAFATVVLAGITIWYAVSTHILLQESRKNQQINLIKSRLEDYYLPLSAFFDLCETDEHLNVNQNSLPNTITFASEKLEIFDNLHKYQYLASTKLKSKIGDFVVMLHDQLPDDYEPKQRARYPYHNQGMEDNEILTIDNKDDIVLFIEMENIVFDDSDKLDEKLSELIE
ncbi:hypothetical protein LI82_03455 [Methanococcoides methylutens]|uniref:Uncharacterized protein n=1 Tax=Methanococcoides methylutens TaxID=2226 RepID=A0A099T2L7_METMT|nr:hypothetical protein [Methanococcoides methylutens]KGK99099.1 hypothetical protein LI82_03455 [Methanococcoides methylutens]